MTETSEIMKALREGLDGLKDTPIDDWTKVVLTKLCKIGQGFRFRVGANTGKVDKASLNWGEWLYDVTWLESDREDRMIRAPLVAECEWGNLEEIKEDFDKLLLARAGVRLMIFDGNYKPGSNEIADELAKRIRAFKGSRAEDAWLLAAWEGSNDNWRFKYYTIDKNYDAIPFQPPSGG